METTSNKEGAVFTLVLSQEKEEIGMLLSVVFGRKAAAGDLTLVFQAINPPLHAHTHPNETGYLVR